MKPDQASVFFFIEDSDTNATVCPEAGGGGSAAAGSVSGSSRATCARRRVKSYRSSQYDWLSASSLRAVFPARAQAAHATSTPATANAQSSISYVNYHSAPLPARAGSRYNAAGPMTRPTNTILICDDDQGMPATLTPNLKRDYRLLPRSSGEPSVS